MVGPPTKISGSGSQDLGTRWSWVLGDGRERGKVFKQQAQYGLTKKPNVSENHKIRDSINLVHTCKWSLWFNFNSDCKAMLFSEG